MRQADREEQIDRLKEARTGKEGEYEGIRERGRKVE